MSNSVIFIVGVVVFAITVWGAVMAGGLALTQVQIDQNEHLKDKSDSDDPDSRSPFRGKY